MFIVPIGINDAKAAPTMISMEDGGSGRKVTGKWIKSSDGRWWYRHSNGSYTKNGWEEIDGKYYLFDAQGWMRTYWANFNGNTYYLGSDGARKIGWENINNKWYHFDIFGKMEKGWIKLLGKWYYLNSIGAMEIGWVKVNDKWYHMNEKGEMQTGWIKLKEKWYYLNENGDMKIGWLQLGNKWYYLNEDGEMEVDWIKLGNLWYYLDSNGEMVVGQRRIRGIDYYFDKTGALEADASLEAVIYTKHYKEDGVNTYTDGTDVIKRLNKDYKVKHYHNYTKKDFFGWDSKLGVANMNKGIFLYSGHGLSEGKGLKLGNDEYITVSNIKNIRMTNTKIAFFFACASASIDKATGESLVTAAVKSGAKVAYGYNDRASSVKDSKVIRMLFYLLKEGYTLKDAISAAKILNNDYNALKEGNLVIFGDDNIKLSNTYKIRSINYSDKQVSIPEGFVDESDIKFAIKVYRKYYNGFETSDRIIYDMDKKEYLEKRDEVNLEKVSKLDFTLFEKHYEELNASGELEEYFDVKKRITNVDGEPTMVLLCEKDTEYDVEFTVINLKDKAIITDKVNIRDLFI